MSVVLQLSNTGNLAMAALVEERYNSIAYKIHCATDSGAIIDGLYYALTGMVRNHFLSGSWHRRCVYEFGSCISNKFVDICDLLVDHEENDLTAA